MHYNNHPVNKLRYFQREKDLSELVLRINNGPDQRRPKESMVTVQSVACRLCYNSLHLSTNAVINRLHLVCYRFDTCQYSCLNDALFCEIILFGLFKALRHYHPHPLSKNQSFFFFRNSSLLGLYFLYTGLGLYTFYTDVLTLNTHQKVD